MRLSGLALVLALAGVGCGGAAAGGESTTASSSSSATAPATADIVDTAVAAGSFNTLAQALTAAGLVETLKGPGPFTVLAPTDAAFAALPAGTLDSLLANPDQLRAILTYHVIAGNHPASEVVTMTSAATVNGANVAIDASSGSVRLNGSATVTTADVQASNGIIHVIDAVLLPPAN